jgi:repressor LexA
MDGNEFTGTGSGEQRVEPCVPVDAALIELPQSTRTFALEVRGDSMAGAGIFDRDIVIMELAPPRHLEIVAALVDGHAVLRRYIVERGVPFLRAESPDYPGLIPAQELVIQGVFRALVRINRARS